MTEQTATRSLPDLSGLIAAVLVVSGVLLSMFVAEGFLILAGLGAFGPGLLRELGWLREQDEFQRQAARRAGYHAYLIGGFAAVLAVAGLKWRETDPHGSAAWVMLVVLILWMTWLFSALLAYWGARKTTARILAIFGSFWLVFAAADIMGAAAKDRPLGMLMALALVAPFFLLAFTAGRWPRPTGAFLLAVCALFAGVIVTVWRARQISISGQLATAVLLLVPLAGCGIALLRSPGQDGGSPRLKQPRSPGSRDTSSSR